MRSKESKTRSKSNEPWRIVEQIVAAAYSSPELEVQTNVRLPSLRSRGGRGGKREIDVLITGRLAGQTIRLPIECKHHNKRADSPKIDSFIGKLLDVGLSTHTSIFVSTAGFTQPAIARAQEVGMRTLVLKKGNFSQAKDQILEAIQARVFMACSLRELTFSTPGMVATDYFNFYDKDGVYKGCLLDLPWQAWLNATPPLVCGRYRYSVEVPENWKYLDNGQKTSIDTIEAEFDVTAHVLQLNGTAQEYQFLDALTNHTERHFLRAQFPTNPSSTSASEFKTEEELNKFLSGISTPAQVTVGRIRLPKIIMNQGILWPQPSIIINQLMKVHPDHRDEAFQRILPGISTNFWDFDSVHDEIVKKSLSGTSIKVHVRALLSDRIDPGT